MKFRTACQDRQSIGKCHYYGHNRMARVAFDRDHVDNNHGALTTRSRYQLDKLLVANYKVRQGLRCSG